MKQLYDKIYIINRVNSTDRWEKVSASFNMADISYEKFVATEGRAIEVTNLEANETVSGRYLQENKIRTLSKVPYYINCSPEKNNPVTFNYWSEAKLTANELGLWCSNLAIWKEAASSGVNNIIIFEDDVSILSPKKFQGQLDNFISSLPSSFDIGFIDMVRWGEVNKINDHVVKFTSKTQGYGTFGVLYSAKGIAKLLSVDHYASPLDLFFLRYEAAKAHRETAAYSVKNFSLEIYGYNRDMMSIVGDSEMERY